MEPQKIAVNLVEEFMQLGSDYLASDIADLSSRMKNVSFYPWRMFSAVPLAKYGTDFTGKEEILKNAVDHWDGAPIYLNHQDEDKSDRAVGKVFRPRYVDSSPGRSTPGIDGIIGIYHKRSPQALAIKLAIDKGEIKATSTTLMTMGHRTHPNMSESEFQKMRGKTDDQGKMIGSTPVEITDVYAQSVLTIPPVVADALRLSTAPDGHPVWQPETSLTSLSMENLKPIRDLLQLSEEDAPTPEAILGSLQLKLAKIKEHESAIAKQEEILQAMRVQLAEEQKQTQSKDAVIEKMKLASEFGEARKDEMLLELAGFYSGQDGEVCDPKTDARIKGASKLESADLLDLYKKEKLRLGHLLPIQGDGSRQQSITQVGVKVSKDSLGLVENGSYRPSHNPFGIAQGAAPGQKEKV